MASLLAGYVEFEEEIAVQMVRESARRATPNVAATRFVRNPDI
ncbi:hypothetical protein ACNS7O_17385 (plasmid) [Haloferacaceae archaeon DSL9]